MTDHKKKPPPPVFLLISLIAMFLLDRFYPVLEFGSVRTTVVGALGLALGLIVTVSSAQLFKRAGTPLRPFEESTAVVTTGMFRVTRNPMYLGMVLGQVGVGVMLGSLTAFTPIPVFVAIIHTQFIVHEERFMEGLFGDEYVAYKKTVRRWI
jgi:protein-S-isoprenylcysteine O-methyltransferase Ste14